MNKKEGTYDMPSENETTFRIGGTNPPQKENDWEEIRARHLTEIIGFIRSCPVKSGECSSCENIITNFIKVALANQKREIVAEIKKVARTYGTPLIRKDFKLLITKINDKK